MKNTILNRKFRYSYSGAAVILVLINVIVYFVSDFVWPYLRAYMALIPAYVHYRHWYWQFFTYMFAHGSFYHLLSNMLALLVFGVALERAIGTREFLLYYLLTGTLCGAAAYISYYLGNVNAVLLGASGAVYSVMLLFAVVFPSSCVLLFGILPIPAPLLVALYFFIEFFSQFSNDGIAHSVHLFGLFFGYLYIRIRMRMKPLKVWGVIS